MTAIYPGSFDPPTLGHLDVIDRAQKIFREVVVAIGVNPTKTPFLSVAERRDVLKECVQHFSNVRVEVFEGLLVEFANSVSASVIVRGLRATSDFDYEFQIASANRRLDPAIDTMFLMTKDEHSFLSSSVVREVATLGGDFSAFVPPPVNELLKRKLDR